MTDSTTFAVNMENGMCLTEEEADPAKFVFTCTPAKYCKSSTGECVKVEASICSDSVGNCYNKPP